MKNKHNWERNDCGVTPTYCQKIWNYCGVKFMAYRLTVQSRLTFVRGVWEKREKPSNRYSWSSYSITVGLSVWNDKQKPQLDEYWNINRDSLILGSWQKETNSYQEVSRRRHSDPVVKQFSCVVVHQTTLFHRLKETQLSKYSTSCMFLQQTGTSCEHKVHWHQDEYNHTAIYIINP